MNLSKKTPSNDAGSLQRSAGAKGRLEPLDQRLWKHVGGGDYPPSGANDRHDPLKK
ncbi:RaxX family RiPP (plasmid) [Xanthomonas axonopodis pv. vasculorum]